MREEIDSCKYLYLTRTGGTRWERAAGCRRGSQGGWLAWRSRDCGQGHQRPPSHQVG